MSLTPMKCVSGDALPEDMERIQLEVLIAQEESRGLGNRLRIGSRSKLRAGAEPVCRRWSALLAFLRSLSLSLFFFFFLDYSVSIVPFLDPLCFGSAPGLFFSFFSSLFSFSFFVLFPLYKGNQKSRTEKSLRRPINTKCLLPLLKPALALPPRMSRRNPQLLVSWAPVCILNPSVVGRLIKY